MSGTPTTVVLALLAACEVVEPTEETGNRAPVAFAGADRVVNPDVPIPLDGRGSYDPDGDELILHWQLQRTPEGSAITNAAFSENHTNVRETTLRPDVPGTYIVELWAEDARGAVSEADLVTLTVIAGTEPLAEARAPETALTGEVLTLDGTWSYDPQGHPITHMWDVASKPSTSGLSAVETPDQVTASVVPDVPGLYVFALTVHNGFIASEPALVHVDVAPASPEAPIADVGADEISGEDCALVELDGSRSYDPNGAPLDYSWELMSRPKESLAGQGSFDDPEAVAPTFYPDVAGTYTAALTVFDGSEWSTSDLVTIQASERAYNTAPQVEAGENIRIDLGTATCTRQFSGYDCDPCAAALVELGTDAWITDSDNDPYDIEWSPYGDEELRILSADRLQAEILLDDISPTEPNACEDTTFNIWLFATDCPGERGTDLLRVTATCCGVP